MQSLDEFASLELACLYFTSSATDTHYYGLVNTIHSTIRRGIEAGIDIRLIQNNPIFIEAWNLFTGYYKEPDSQHPSNVIYLSERLTPD
jgi:hypothetical protein